MNAPPPEIRRGRRFAPWAGLVGAFVGALVQHQGIGDALHYRCGPGMNDADVVAGAVALLIMALGALISWRALRHEADGTGTRRLIAQVSLMAVALFALLVVWATLAGIIVPSCPS